MRREVMVVLVLMFVGCGPSVKFFPMNDPPDLVQPDKIEVFAQQPDRPYVDLGIIKVRARTSFLSSPEKMMTLLKERARKVGADAIIVGALSSETIVSGGVKDGSGGISSSSKDVVQAVAIAWKE